MFFFDQDVEKIEAKIKDEQQEVKSEGETEEVSGLYFTLSDALWEDILYHVLIYIWQKRKVTDL